MTVPRRASTIFDAVPGYEPWGPAAAAAVDLWSAPAAPAPTAATAVLDAPDDDASPSGTRRAPGARRRQKATKVVKAKVVRAPRVARVAEADDLTAREPARERLTRRMPARRARSGRSVTAVATAVVEPDAGDTAELGVAVPVRRPVTVRIVLGQVLRSVCTLFAFVLAVAAALMVAEANTANHLVTYAQQAADHLDLAVFDVDNGVMKFTGDRSDLKNALFNRGVAALVWLFIGRTLERLVAGRPVVR